MVERSFDWKNERNFLPALTAAMAVLVLFPLLGTYGLWEPHEINIAETARKIASEGGYWAVIKSKPPLSTWLMASSLNLFGVSEFAARLPMALMGMIALLATYSLGATLGKPRAGLYAAVVLLASPLFVFESRQLTSDVSSVAMVTVAMLGLVRLLWPAAGRSPVRMTLDLAAAAVGLTLGFFASGLLLGVFVPLLVVSIAALVAALAKEGAPIGRKHLLIGAAITGGLALLALGVVLVAIYNWIPAQAGKTAFFGKSLTVAKGYSIALGGIWRDSAVGKQVGFDWIVNQVAFGMFPWSALAPLAVLRLALSPRDDEDARARFIGYAMLLWALVAYVVSTIWLRKVGMLRFSALAPIAFAVGVWIDNRHGKSLPWTQPTKYSGLPLVALFVFAAAVQLARDIAKFPDELGSVHLLATAKFPVEASYLRWIVLVIGLLFAGCAACGLGVDSGDGKKRGIFAKLRGASQYGVWAALALSLIFALFLSLVFTPGVSEHFSYKNVFNSYLEHRKNGEKLGVLGIPESGAAYYSHGHYETLAGRGRLHQFLAEPERVFVVTRAAELCPAHEASSEGAFSYHVIDNSNSHFLLLSNRLAVGEKDENPLLSAITRTPPQSISHAVSANFEDTIELIGYDMPQSVSSGHKFTVNLYYHVLGKPRMNYKVFMHFDGCGSPHFQGDHDPIRGRCGTIFWQPGDYIVDTVEVTAGGLTHSGTCTLNMGFFTGSTGRWKNMVVKSGNGDKNNRVTLGSIVLK